MTDSLDHRSNVRAKLANDPEWLSKYVSKVIPMWQCQTNLLLAKVPGTSISQGQGKGNTTVNLCNNSKISS